ncbi:MAG: hypothetical protein OEM00_05710 [Burkholderiaceae bacterium]|nr:hypothetical protein [Burkholderiaceae bacterium]MDH3460466.1 hypothetical protein [Burkholderiaceae bacterium]
MQTTPNKVISGLAEFHTAVREAMAEAVTARWPELWLCDINFADWPLGDISVVESLTQWAQGQRQCRLTLLALQYDEMPRRHPRWVQWRRQWSHSVTCRQLQDVQADDVPVTMLAPGAMTIRLLDPLHHRGVVSHTPSDWLQARELIDAISQRSIEAFPITTLGL